MKHLPLLFMLFLLAWQTEAQSPDVPRDTSFTVYSTWQKERKNFPFIQPVKPVRPKGVRVEEQVVYASPGGRNLLVDVYYPRHKNKRSTYPGVLLIHGGGWSSGDKTMEAPMALALAARGYVAVTVEYRLTPEAGYPAAVHDVKAAVRWMRAHAARYRLDPTRIAALGTSSGGQLAAFLGATNQNPRFEGEVGDLSYSSEVQAVVDIDGVLAFDHPESKEYGDNPAKPSAATRWFGVPFAGNPALWQDAAALTHANRHTPPFLFINSSLPRFHAGRDDLIRKLDAFGTYSEVHTLPDTPHPFWLFHPWFAPTAGWVGDFLDKVFAHH